MVLLPSRCRRRRKPSRGRSKSKLLKRKGRNLNMSNVVASKESRPVREQRERRQERQRWIQPQVNIVESRDRYVLEAEMPGVSKEGLEVLLEGNELTIVGRKSPTQLDAQL